MRSKETCTKMKNQDKTPEKELNKMETSNLLDAESKTLVICMFDDLKRTVDILRTSTKTQET